MLAQLNACARVSKKSIEVVAALLWDEASC